jgi:hypothetical protein
MSFQARLFLQLLSIIMVVFSVAASGFIVYVRAVLNESDTHQKESQVNQIEQQLNRFANETAQRVENIADAETMTRMAIDLAHSNASQYLYSRDAIGAAQNQNLDLLEITSWDGTVISSVQDHSRVGRKANAKSAKEDLSVSHAFLEKQQLHGGWVLAFSAESSICVDGRTFYVTGGRRVDQTLLSSLILPPSMRVLLYRNFSASRFEPTDLLDRNGVVSQAQRFAPLVEEVKRGVQTVTRTIGWTDDPTSAETFYFVPLFGRNKELLGILLVGSSYRELSALMHRIRWLTLGFAATAFVVALPICFWIASRFSTIRLPAATKPGPTA